jgi:hypothetical protein
MIRTAPSSTRARRWLAAWTLALALAAAAGPAAAGQPWEYVLTRDGVVVHQRTVPGRGFPTFRGLGIVNSDMFQVLAVLRDVNRHSQWMERSAETYMIEKTDEFHYTVYGRTDAPWPVSDRDAVFRSAVKVDYRRKVVTVHFWAVRSRRKPPVKGVVRMTRLRGYFRFRALGKDRTYVTYVVDADPQGSIPGWIARLATRTLPVGTISNLRRQARRTRGWYDTWIRRWEAIYREALQKPGTAPGK